jgi:hypothetical protein
MFIPKGQYIQSILCFLKSLADQLLFMACLSQKNSHSIFDQNLSTIVYQNVRAMTLDPEVYSDAENFDPDRYIPKDQGGRSEPFPVGNFGFGRR